MFPEVGATELMVIAAVALIVVGPKDLPVLMRKVGQFMARMRGMAAEFRSSFDEMARQSELDELRREVQALRTGNLDLVADAAQHIDEAAVDKMFYDIDRELKADPAYEAYAAPPEPVAEAPALPPPVKTKPKPRAKAAPGDAKPAAKPAPAKPQAPDKAKVATPKAAKPRAGAKP